MASTNVRFALLVLSFFITTVLSVKQPRFKIDSRIVGGRDSIKGHFPYYVSLVDSSQTHFCGGSIISKYHILTAAHCHNSTENLHMDPTEILAVLGVTQMTTNVTVKQIESISIHKRFDPNIFINDIALLKTVGEIEFSQFIQPIRIVSSNFVATNRCEATMCGLGFIHFSKGGHGIDPENLQYLNTVTLPKAECRKEFERRYNENRNDWYLTMAMLRGKTFCATNGRENASPCYGDSGGPLVANGVLIGVFNVIVGCDLGYPALYTNIYEYRRWLMIEMRRTLSEDERRSIFPGENPRNVPVEELEEDLSFSLVEFLKNRRN